MIKERRLDLLLVHPGSNKKVYEGLADDFAAIEPPFCAALTAGFIRKKGFSVDIIDANADNLTYEEVAKKVSEIKPRLVNIIAHGQQPSASSHLMGAVGETCKAIKERFDVPIILRGVHPSALPERTLREENCDFIGRGEGYSTLTGLLRRGIPEKIPGLCYLRNGEFNVNRASPLIEDLSGVLPEVAWDLLPMNKYRSHNWQAFDNLDKRQPYASLYTSLGCPFQCSFCCINAEFNVAVSDNSNNVISKKQDSLMAAMDGAKAKIRYWNPDIVLKHLDTLVNEYGVRHMKFIDEMFVFNKNHVRKIADGIIERGYDLDIWAYARVDTLNDIPLLEKIKKAGINWLVIGIESGSKHVRQGTKKRYDNEAIINAVKRVESTGINVMGNYMFGLPDDTYETMQETLNLALELNTLWYNGYATVAYPGAPIYSEAKRRGIPLPGDKNVPGGWTAFSHHSYFSFPLPTETLPNQEVLAFRDKAFNTYFTNPSYLALVEKKYGQKVVNHLKKMTSHKIKRRILGDKTAEEYYQHR